MNSLKEVRDLVRAYRQYRENRISLIASENRSSRLLNASYLLGLGDQYCSRLPSEANSIGNLSFGHIGVLDAINQAAREKVKKTFRAEECEIRLLSGLSGLTVLLFSLLDRGDLLFKVHDLHGGHLSVKPIAERLQVRMHEMTLGRDFRLDMDELRRNYDREKPCVIFLDSSYVLFPYPLREIRELVSKDTVIVYDASHVMGLIAGSRFQSPFEEGADMIHSTTHKTIWGPQKAMILFKTKGELCNKVQDTVKYSLVSNTHMHHILALLIAVEEVQSFGAEYASRLAHNARFLAERLDERGLSIAAKEYGYTQSHQFWIDCETEAKAIDAFKKLEAIRISTNVIFLPGGRWGLRIGLNEITRLGVDDGTLNDLAELMSDAVLERQSKAILLDEAGRLKRRLKHPQFSFDNTPEGQELLELLLSTVQSSISQGMTTVQ